MGLLPSGQAAGDPEPFLQSNLLDTGATFSPDGEWVAFVSERSGTREVWLSDAEGERLRRLTSLDSGWNMFPVWSPDGAWLAFDAQVGDARYDVYVVGRMGGKPRAVTSDPGDEVAPRWSMDGQRLLFESDRGGKRQLWSVPNEGGDPTLAEGAAPAVDDPAGTFRYFAEPTEGGWTIRRQPSRGGPVETVVNRAANPEFAVTSRGVYFAAKDPPDSTFPTHVAFLDLDTGQTTKIVDLRPGTATGESISVSPDERTLLYTQCDLEGEDDLILIENFR